MSEERTSKEIIDDLRRAVENADSAMDEVVECYGRAIRRIENLAEHDTFSAFRAFEEHGVKIGCVFEIGEMRVRVTGKYDKGFCYEDLGELKPNCTRHGSFDVGRIVHKIPEIRVCEAEGGAP